MNKILRPTHQKRIAFFLLIDIIFVILSLYIAFLFRFDFEFPKIYVPLFKKLLPLFLITKIGIFWFFNLYNITWKYVGLYDFFNIVKASFLSTTIIGVIIYFLRHPYFAGTPRSVIIMDFFIWLFLSSATRVSKRVFLEFFRGKKAKNRGRPTLIIGVGYLGEALVRDMTREETDYLPVCFFDEEPSLFGSYIHGLPVYGPFSLLPKIIERYGIKVAIIAQPSLSRRKLRELHSLLKNTKVEEIKILPGFYGHDSKKPSVKKLEDIKIEDLLGREEVKIDTEAIAGFISERKVLVTGAAGSIGSELSKQILSYSPESLILFEIDESRLFELHYTLKELYPEKDNKIVPVVGDIRDKEKLDKVFDKYRPQIVFHTAAYKHVPLMEYYPEEAIKTNIIGTYNLCEVSQKYNVEKFVLISTDKAVNPKSVMGKTKKIAEEIIKTFNARSHTEFVAVRFGNVLGSRGSVVPIFLQQIKRGGPITVTDPKMKRYFMTIPEAVALVLEAAVIGKGGEILVLDMGEPVSIQELAEELIRLNDLVPGKDIKIEIIGSRPGEKFVEELITKRENVKKTLYDRIFIVEGENNQLIERKDITFFIEEFLNNQPEKEV